jgi:hypothetical protein
MVVQPRWGTVYCELEKFPTPQQLSDILLGLAEYWPHTAVIDHWSIGMSHNEPTLSINWKVVS